MQASVGTSAAKLDLSGYPDRGSRGQTIIVQNLGPGDVFLDAVAGVTSASGLKLVPGNAYEMRTDGSQEIYAVASQTSDVRVVVIG